jgi:hypothetical protein
MTGGHMHGSISATERGVAMGCQQAAPGAAAVHVRPPVAPSPSAVEASVAEPQVLDALPLLAARLQERHPAASPAMVQRSLEDAVRALSTVRVRLYLPILIERSALEALRQVLRSRAGAASTSPPSSGLDL